MRYRNIKLGDGSWLDVVYTTEGEFSVSVEVHTVEWAARMGGPVTVVDSEQDQRAGALTPQPVVTDSPIRDRDADLETALGSATTVNALKAAMLDWVKQR